jgi:hypothetical protein
MVTLVTFLACAARFGFVCGAEPQLDDGPQRLFHRFLDRLKLDAPVAGEFEIKRTPAKGLGDMPQQDRLLRCRWAWEPGREMLEGLPESNLFEHFLATRGVFLQGMGAPELQLVSAKICLSAASFELLLSSRLAAVVRTGRCASDIRRKRRSHATWNARPPRETTHWRGKAVYS